MVVSTAAVGGDTEGRFAIKGYGLRTCSEFLQARQAQSPEYLRFGGWLNGYLTASNRYEPRTFDLASWQDTPIMASWLAEYCDGHGQLPFMEAVGALVNRLGEDRLQDFSKPVELPQPMSSVLYEATLRRAQARLVELGYLEGAISGEFDPETSAALQAYQRAEDLKPTGLPDQSTLAKLLQPAAAVRHRGIR